MTLPDSAAQVVARFLRANHYTETLEVFIREAGLPEDAGSIEPGSWNIDQILQEKLQFDTSVKFERTGDNLKQKWSSPAPSVCQEPQLGINSNVLCVGGNLERNKISVTTADRTWRLCSAQDPFVSNTSVTKSGDSPVLSTVFVPGGYVLTTSMSGHLSLRDASTLSLVDECRNHMKYAVQVVSSMYQQEWFIATAGWDQKIHVYAPKMLARNDLPENVVGTETAALPGWLGDPIHTITLTTNPESLVFVRHPDTQKLYLVASRRDSTHIYYYQIQHEASGQVLVYEAGRQNLAPHANAWVAFTPCSLSLCPTDPSLLAVATSHIPHMKVIIVRLLFPVKDAAIDTAPVEYLTQASMARGELATQDREDAAIRINVTTMAPQTPYSTPQVVWRPDGTGLFVNGDDGAIRGIEVTSGKVVSLLKGHEIGSKVRTLWSGTISTGDGGQDQEILLSGGFDKKLLVWTVPARG